MERERETRKTCGDNSRNQLDPGTGPDPGFIDIFHGICRTKQFWETNSIGSFNMFYPSKGVLRKCISLLNRTETVMDLWWEKQVIYSVAVDQDHFRQKLAIQFAVIMGR